MYTHNPIELSPGVKEPMCGYQWLWQHQHDLDGWQPRIELDFGNGTKQTIQGRPNAVIEAVKINLQK